MVFYMSYLSNCLYQILSHFTTISYPIVNDFLVDHRWLRANKQMIKIYYIIFLVNALTQFVQFSLHRLGDCLCQYSTTYQTQTNSFPWGGILDRL